MRVDIHPLALRYPPLDGPEFAALKADIQAHGLRNPLWFYQEKLLDGRNRLRVCEELGIEPEWKEFEGTEDQAAAFVDSQNLHRRHLTREQKRDLVAERLKADPGQSNRVIAADLRVDDKTVATVRKELEATAEIPQLAATTGADGKARPAAKPKKTPADPKPEPKPGSRSRSSKASSAAKPSASPKPTPEPTPPKSAWSELADLLSRVAAAIEALTPNKAEETEPWKLVDSLESTAKTLLRRARDVRRRHHL